MSIPVTKNRQVAPLQIHISLKIFETDKLSYWLENQIAC